jgi:hypothetical protein
MKRSAVRTGRDLINRCRILNELLRRHGATLVAAGEFPIAFSVNENNVENFKVRGAPTRSTKSFLEIWVSFRHAAASCRNTTSTAKR